MPGTMLFTVAEAAEQLRVAPRTIRRLIEAGEIPAVTVRRAVRIRAADLRTYVDAHVHKKHNPRNGS